MVKNKDFTLAVQNLSGRRAFRAYTPILVLLVYTPIQSTYYTIVMSYVFIPHTATSQFHFTAKCEHCLLLIINSSSDIIRHHSSHLIWLVNCAHQQFDIYLLQRGSIPLLLKVDSNWGEASVITKERRKSYNF